jgi:hypothetical protein
MLVNSELGFLDASMRPMWARVRAAYFDATVKDEADTILCNGFGQSISMLAKCVDSPIPEIIAVGETTRSLTPALLQLFQLHSRQPNKWFVEAWYSKTAFSEIFSSQNLVNLP